MPRRPPISTLFPYTTLFRSQLRRVRRRAVRAILRRRRASGVATRTVFSIAADRVFRRLDRKSTRLNSSHLGISYAVFCLKKKTKHKQKVRISTKHDEEHGCK